jgi:hypothetical protein
VWLAEGREGTGEEGHTLPSCTGSVSDTIIRLVEWTTKKTHARRTMHEALRGGVQQRERPSRGCGSRQKGCAQAMAATHHGCRLVSHKTLRTISAFILDVQLTEFSLLAELAAPRHFKVALVPSRSSRPHLTTRSICTHQHLARATRGVQLRPRQLTGERAARGLS